MWRKQRRKRPVAGARSNWRPIDNPGLPGAMSATRDRESLNGASVTVGRAPLAVAVNEATNTIYVANRNDNTVSVIDGATCDATNHSGCGRTRRTMATSGGTSIAIDQAADTVFVGSVHDSDALSSMAQHAMLPSRRAAASRPRSCPRVAGRATWSSTKPPGRST